MSWFNKDKQRIEELEKDNYILRKKYESLLDDSIRDSYFKTKLIDDFTRLMKENRALKRQVSKLKHDYEILEKAHELLGLGFLHMK
jgi:hypothetical protein